MTADDTAPLPIDDNFTLDPVRLRGSRCPSCDAVFFPRRVLCARDASTCEEIALGPDATLHAFTQVHDAAMGFVGGGGGALLGQVVLDEGVHVQSLLTGATFAELRIGDRMHAGLLEVRRDEATGRPVVAYAFSPLGAGS